jgi:formamidopyrimidine-DNA glycosylase
MELSNGKCLLFHFGMTGSFAIQGEQIPTYKTFSVSSLWPPKFCKFEVVFSDGGRVAYCDPRRLGKIRICEKDLLYEIPPLSQLAIDPVLDDLNYDEIFTKFQRTSIAVKALILDQERVFSGVGNWIADEIM